ncbi:alpha/beta hydrolase [Legionella septentrionalis]|uniref:alpha/beta hydrolase n=1 Tax=Legionella septentrionalis TaxID=2498109 RepID=UPI000F8F0899|nr:alpha/beta fold hydrolase [Legionella septentrionalis]RUR11266.1 alpha/beta fold hydrolase [Legionella septentrionalis]
MNIDDFRYMRRGKHIKALPLQQATLLSPIDKRNGKKEKALLLLHGFSSSPAVFRELVPALSMYDTILAPVLPGHGESIAAFASVKSKDWLTAAEHACAHLVQEYSMVDVMGLSLGGLLACHLSNKFSLHHLYLLAPALALRLKISPALNLAYGLQKLGFKKLRNRAGNIYSKSAYELAYRQLPISSISEILALISTFKFIPPTCPTDIFLGFYDEVIHSAKVADYFANLPHARVHWLNNSAHVLPLDTDAETIVACVQQNWKN